MKMCIRDRDENGNYTKNKVTDPGQASPIPLKDITPTISGGFRCV